MMVDVVINLWVTLHYMPHCNQYTTPCQLHDSDWQAHQGSLAYMAEVQYIHIIDALCLPSCLLIDHFSHALITDMSCSQITKVSWCYRTSVPVR
jgi:hypothetical protein